MAGGQILAFPIDIDRRPYNTLALPCECVMSASFINIGGHVENVRKITILKE